MKLLMIGKTDENDESVVMPPLGRKSGMSCK